MTRPDLDTGSYVPYSWREVCGFVKFPANRCKEDAGDRAYGLSSLSKKLECISIWQWQSRGNTFSSSI